MSEGFYESSTDESREQVESYRSSKLNLPVMACTPWRVKAQTLPRFILVVIDITTVLTGNLIPDASLRCTSWQRQDLSRCIFADLSFNTGGGNSNESS